MNPHFHAEFDPNCEGCRPAMADVSTGRTYPPDHPTMVIVNELWDAAPLEEKKACFRIWCHNSRAREDLELGAKFFERVQVRLKSS